MGRVVDVTTRGAKVRIETVARKQATISISEVTMGSVPSRFIEVNKIFENAKRPIAVFDLDGTLVETDAANSAAYAKVLWTEGVSGMAGIAGRISSKVIRQTFPELGSSELNEIVRRKVATYCHELWRTQLGLAAEALTCVIVNRSLFDKVVLLTDSTEQRAMETLRHHKLDSLFDEIVCNGGRGNKYANYFEGYDSDPAACVVWENESGMVQSAIAAGVKINNIRKVG